MTGEKAAYRIRAPTDSPFALARTVPLPPLPPLASSPAANEITATNGDGASGNPTLALSLTFDISGKTSTKPVKTGTAMPGTCSVGELFYKSDASAGQNLFGCTSPNLDSAGRRSPDGCSLLDVLGGGRYVGGVQSRVNVTVPGNLTVQGAINAGS